MTPTSAAVQPPLHEQTTDCIALTDVQIAAEINASVNWVRKDRSGARYLPFYRIGGLVRYNRQRVLEALAPFEEGGAGLKRKATTA
jgi:hypothetical protein